MWAIAERVDGLPGVMHELGSEANAAARRLLDAVTALDSELGVLARDASPAELRSIEQKLKSPGDASEASPHRKELRQMLVNQSDLLQRRATCDCIDHPI